MYVMLFLKKESTWVRKLNTDIWTSQIGQPSPRQDLATGTAPLPKLGGSLVLGVGYDPFIKISYPVPRIDL